MEEPDLPHEEYPKLGFPLHIANITYLNKDFIDRMIANHANLTQDGGDHHLNPMPQTHFQILSQKS